MTVHCLEINASTSITSGKTPQELKQTVQDYIAANNEVLPEQKTEFSAGETIDGSVSYFRGTFRLLLSDDGGSKTKAQVKQDMEGFLSNNFEWWQWRYHECNHDEDPGNRTTVCSWNASNDSGNVPAEVMY